MRKIELNKCYKHKNGLKYRVIDLNVLTQINGEWIESVRYECVDKKFPYTFVRTRDDFIRSFKKVDCS